MKMLTKPQLTKKLAAEVDRSTQHTKIIDHLDSICEKLHKENDSMGARAAGFESQIEELNADSTTLVARIEYLENELQEREHYLRTLEADMASVELGHSRQIDTLKQDLYNEQLKSTAYLTVIKTLNER
jgi:chromosome segregation ATPase